MSFAAGFAQGFVPSFQAGIARKEKRREDTFKMKFDDFSKRNEVRSKYIAEDRQAIKKAKALTEGLDVPEGAWMKAYEWTKAGLDEDTIVERLSKGTFTASEMPAGEVSKPPASPVAQTQEALSPTPAATPMSPTAGGKSPKKPLGVKGSLEKGMGNFGGIFKRTTQESINEDALKRVADVSGMSVDEVQQIYDWMPEPMVDTSGAPAYTAGVDPVDLPEHDQALYNYQNAPTETERLEAKKQLDAIREAKIFESGLRAREQGNLGAGQMVKYKDPETGEITSTFAAPSADGTGFVDMDGNPIPNPMNISKMEENAMEELYKDVDSDAAKEYRNKTNALVRMYRLGGQMGQLVEDTPELTAPFSSGLVSTGQKLIAEGFAARDILAGTSPEGIVQKITSGKGPVTITHEEAKRLESYKQALESGSIDERVRATMGDKAYKIAVNKQLFDTNVALMGYALGVAEGQEGRSLQEKEREMFMKLAQGGVGSSDKFYQNMGQMLNNMRSDLDSQSMAMNKMNVKVGNFKERFRWAPPFAQVTPADDLIQRNSQEDPTFGAYVSKFDQYKPGTPSLQNDLGKRSQQGSAPVQSGVPQGSRPIGRLPDGRTVYETPDGQQIVN